MECGGKKLGQPSTTQTTQSATRITQIGLTQFLKLCLPRPINPAPSLGEQPQKQVVPTPLSVNAHPPVAVDLISQALPPMEETMEQMRRVGWTNAQGRLFLQENFGVPTRKELSRPQMQQFLEHLRAVNGGNACLPASLPTLDRVPAPS